MAPGSLTAAQLPISTGVAQTTVPRSASRPVLAVAASVTATVMARFTVAPVGIFEGIVMRVFWYTDFTATCTTPWPAPAPLAPCRGPLRGPRRTPRSPTCSHGMGATARRRRPLDPAGGLGDAFAGPAPCRVFQALVRTADPSCRHRLFVRCSPRRALPRQTARRQGSSRKRHQ